MFICICKAVTVDQLNQLIDAGVGSLGEIQEKSGAGSDCGSCRSRIDKQLTRKTPKKAEKKNRSE